MLRARYGRSLGSENQELALRLLCPAPTSRFSAAIQARLHECCQQPASPCHATEGGHVGRLADRVDGPRWLKSSEQHGPDKHRRGPSTTRHKRVPRDESARRFAQDDASVGELTERRPLCGSRGACGLLRDIALVARSRRTSAVLIWPMLFRAFQPSSPDVAGPLWSFPWERESRTCSPLAMSGAYI